VFGYSGNPAGLAMSLATGGVIALFGCYEQYKPVAVAGLLAAVSPLILSSRLVSAATWSLVLLGAATALLAGYQGFFAERRANVRGGQWTLN
jgi:Na+/H+-translocating membrane pyrophosphatase